MGRLAVVLDHRVQLQLAEVLAAQSVLNGQVGRALEAVALTADRYDSELAELRGELAQLGRQVAALAYLVEKHAAR